MLKYTAGLLIVLLAAVLPAAAASTGVTVRIEGVPSGYRVNVGVSYSGVSGPVFQSFQSREGSGTLGFSIDSKAARVSVEANASIGGKTCRGYEQYSSPPREVTINLSKNCR